MAEYYDGTKLLSMKDIRGIGISRGLRHMFHVRLTFLPTFH